MNYDRRVVENLKPKKTSRELPYLKAAMVLFFLLFVCTILIKELQHL